jgi:hypothetical protein
MASFNNIREYVSAINGGAFVTSSFRKVPSQDSVAGWWTDLSMAAGNPIPNYYASNPLAAALLSDNEGIFHGMARVGYTTYLTELMAMTATANMAGTYRLLDYLLYYPFVDLDDTGLQTMNNSLYSLTRYTDGSGVMAMMVCVAPTTGGGRFTFNYIDQDGNPQTSPINYYSISAANIASIVTSEPGQATSGGPYLRLASGSTGIRRIIDFQNIVSNGGLGSIVLVKPLVDVAIMEASTASELSMVNMKCGLPIIQDGAYLNFICNTIGTIKSGLLTGRVNFTWK